MSAFEFLEYMAAMKNLNMKSAKKRITDLLEILGLSDTGKKHIGGFSGGMKQRVGIAQALLNDPKVLIVDEPTVGLDPVERINFRNLLASIAGDRVIILSTHIVSDIESIAPRIVILEGGELVANTTPEDIVSQSEGNVWNTLVAPEQLVTFQNKFVISSFMQRADGLHLRIISKNKPCLDSEQVQPSLEDGYLRMIRKAGVGV